MAQGAEQAQVTRLHFGAALLGIGGDVIDVEFQGVGAGRLQGAGMGDPAAHRHAVEAGDDRNPQGLLEPAQMFQIAVQGGRIVVVIGQEVGGLGEAGVLFAQEAGAGLGLGGQGLLEQGPEDDGAGAGVLQLPAGVEAAAEGRG